MKLQSPYNGETVIVRKNTPAANFHINLGWEDITPPPTARQLAQRKRFKQMGDLLLAKSFLRYVTHQANLDWSPQDKSMLMNTINILRAKHKRIQLS